MKKIFFVLVVLSLILCGFAFATSDTVQVDYSTVNEINDLINKNAVATIWVEYDENDDSVMTVYGGYPTDSYSSSASVNNPSQDSYEPYVPDLAPGEVYYYPGGSAAMRIPEHG